jgi:hypothetical protein
MRTWDLSKATEQIAAIIRQRSADAIVDVDTDLRTLAPGGVSATWRRARVPDVRLYVRFWRIADTAKREAEVVVSWGSVDASAAGAVAFGRLVSDVAAIACEIEVLTAGVAFTVEQAK